MSDKTADYWAEQIEKDREGFRQFIASLRSENERLTRELGDAHEYVDGMERANVKNRQAKEAAEARVTELEIRLPKYIPIERLEAAEAENARLSGEVAELSAIVKRTVKEAGVQKTEAENWRVSAIKAHAAMAETRAAFSTAEQGLLELIPLLGLDTESANCLLYGPAKEWVPRVVAALKASRPLEEARERVLEQARLVCEKAEVTFEDIAELRRRGKACAAIEKAKEVS